MNSENNKMTYDELKFRQSWTLERKIDHSLGVIENFYTTLNGKVYIAFSGGKDSTVLYWLAKKIYPNIKAVFCNTRNEYPEIVKFVREQKNQGNNIDIIYPEYTIKQVIEEFGFPLISKETSYKMWYVKNKPNSKTAELALIDNANNRFFNIPHKYRFLINEPYNISHWCCEKLKKEPFHKYEKENDLSPIIGTMACESIMRQNTYIKKGGCNTFNSIDRRKQKSMPLSIWMEEDIWECVRRYNIPISTIYEKGITRTGCMLCGFGAQIKGDNRLELCYSLYPKAYNRFMSFENNGVAYKDALKNVLSQNNVILPDERENQLTLF